MEREEFNAEQRSKLLDLACQAADMLDDLGEHALGDAILVVETAHPDGEARVHFFSTTLRQIVNRGLVEFARENLCIAEPMDDHGE